MKRAVLILSILCAFNALVLAGPEPYSGKEMKQVAPAPTCYNWTGFYAGAQIGYKFANVDPDLELTGFWITGPEVPTLESIGSDDLDTGGFELGGLLGYNRQFGCGLVIGVEAAASYLWLDQTNDTGPFPLFGIYDVHSSFESNFLITAAPRIGWAMGRWLPYVTGGLAVGNFEFAQTIDELTSGFHQAGRVDDVQIGWMVGGGLQYAITEHWSARVQYQYIDLGDVDFSTDADPPFQGYTGEHNASLTEHNATVAIIYGF